MTSPAYHGPTGPNARPRADGVAKITGAARYAADHAVPGLRHAVLVTAAVPAGRITAVDAAAAERMPGVVAVLTHHNAPRLDPPAGAPYGGRLPLQDDLIRYEGEPVAVVVADRLDRAQAAAALVQVISAPVDCVVGLDDAAGSAYVPTPPERWGPADAGVGDVEAGLAGATVRMRGRYTTAARHHCPIETSATLAEWRDGALTLHDATQGVFNVQAVVASTLGLPPDRVRVLAPFTGGGFGSKGYVWPHQIIAAMVARALGGAVRLALTRAQSFTGHGYQPPTRQTVELAATADGKLTAIRHESLSATADYGEYVEMAANASRAAYACPAIETRHRVAPVATVLPTPMRAPHEGTGMFALESAMDELSYQLGMDPLELRLRNYAEVDPLTGQPFSGKLLHACYWEGARRIGWSRRPRGVRSMRRGGELIGLGMATAVMGTVRFPAAARVGIGADGTVLVEAGCQEIGTGTYTILAQTAAEVLGCRPEQVHVRLGDTTLPRTGMTAGSSTTIGVGSAVHDAARGLLAELTALAAVGESDGAEVLAVEGTNVLLKNAPVTTLGLGELLARREGAALSVQGHWAPQRSAYSMHSFGAVFAEVAVDELLCVPRVRRLVAVYSAGRIVNPLTAHSQMTGGLVWGIGQALLERSDTDPVLGRFVAKNLAGYLVPVNADAPGLEVAFTDEHDDHTSSIGVRGIGELGAVGVSAAIANAIHHATGVRVRDLPIGPEALVRAESGAGGG